jgi:four helix bundle protein
MGVLEKKSFDFAVEIARVCKQLDERKNFILARQMFRSGTSIGANIREAGQSESRLDFIHKLKISMKEAEETMYWLEIVHELEKDLYKTSLKTDLIEIKKILGSSISTAKRNQKSSKRILTFILILGSIFNF